MPLKEILAGPGRALNVGSCPATETDKTLETVTPARRIRVNACRNDDSDYDSLVVARCAKSLVIALLILMMGLHWTLLQTVAWATMLATNLRTLSVSEAVCDTFDGKHPCCMCKAIAAGKKSEKKSEATSPISKLEFPPLAKEFVLVSTKLEAAFSRTNQFADSFFLKPPLPPPRGFFA